jgi:DNA-binding response OmpR family regulator
VVTGEAWPPAKVLIVEDDPTVGGVLKRLLARDGYAIAETGESERAVEIISQEKPDVIILDVAMPGITGIEICRRLRQDPASHLTPVIMVTGLDDLETCVKGLEAGADDFLNKPVDPRELRERVRSFVQVKRYTDDSG